jgi:hypothetical protein
MQPVRGSTNQVRRGHDAKHLTAADPLGPGSKGHHSRDFTANTLDIIAVRGARSKSVKRAADEKEMEAAQDTALPGTRTVPSDRRWHLDKIK